MGKVKQRDPELVIYCGPMFGGKTSRMLSALDRAKYQSKTIVVIKPRMDHRYASGEVVTHGGYRWPAVCVASGQEILDVANGADVVAVDEVFMINGAAEALIQLFKLGKDVYVSSIQLSARGEPFDEIQQLFPWATKVEVCPAVCPRTGRDAFYTVATVEDLNEIDVGGDDKYEPRCHQHTFFMGDRE